MQRGRLNKKFLSRVFLILLIPLCVFLHLIFYSVRSAWILSAVNHSSERLKKTEMEDPISTAFSGLPSEFVKQGCQKTNKNQNYTVCDHLPYSEIKCGKLAARRDFDENGIKYKVPNIVHFIWLGQPAFEYYNYLAIRSIASIQQPEKITIYYDKAKPSGPMWERTAREVPCLEFKQIARPTIVLGKKISHTVPQTDAARLQILIEKGGIYIDGDVITLRNFDSLRKFSVTMGRSLADIISMGITLSEPNAPFLQAFYHQYPSHFEDLPGKDWKFATYYLMTFYRENMEKDWIHIEDTSMQRPNSAISHDGKTATTFDHFDLTGHYFLHLHPTTVFGTIIERNQFFSQRDDQIRTADTTYGEAARLAVFNRSDLIFKSGETPRNRVPAKKIVRLEPIQPIRRTTQN
ncbi:uncharacterized protein LOC143461711 isoform X1 [Clavelina lepadiformis]|uniref:uncharacterized protein LOC143461711 isoform X1 n=1 Tax=Clavelina lepadiformis TaxID=159417 RepID=UPI004041043A